MRYWFALKKLFANRNELASFITSEGLNIARLVDISVEYLQQRNTKALILDFDGVMAEHGEQLPKLEVSQWLEDLSTNLPTLEIFILSNKPTKQRADFFKNNFPKVEFVQAARKKPYPDGIQSVLAKRKLDNAQYLMVDDRLATGILAAVACQIQAVWITCPYADFTGNRLVEGFFVFLRKLDKLLILLFNKF